MFSFVPKKISESFLFYVEQKQGQDQTETLVLRQCD